jgi:hypothetical protein
MILKDFGKAKSFKKSSRKELTGGQDLDSLRKFAQNTAARPVNTSSSFPGHSPVQHSAIEFEDTNLWLCPELVLDS